MRSRHAVRVVWSIFGLIDWSVVTSWERNQTVTLGSFNCSPVKSRRFSVFSSVGFFESCGWMDVRWRSSGGPVYASSAPLCGGMHDWTLQTVPRNHRLMALPRMTLRRRVGTFWKSRISVADKQARAFSWRCRQSTARVCCRISAANSARWSPCSTIAKAKR